MIGDSYGDGNIYEGKDSTKSNISTYLTFSLEGTDMNKTTNEESFKLGKQCKHGQLARSCEICELEARNIELEKENKELRKSVRDNDYPVSHYAYQRCYDEKQELEKEVERLKEQADFEVNKATHLAWVKGQRAIEKLERISKLPFRNDVAEILVEEG